MNSFYIAKATHIVAAKILMYLKIPGPSCSKHRKLNELVKGHFVNCLVDSIYNILIIFAEKM